MNAPHPLQQQPATSQVALAPATLGNERQVDLLEYWDIVVDNKWLIALTTAVALLGGVAYAFLARPQYEANLLIQVEDSAGSAKSFLGEAASLFDVKTPAAAEMEIIRSRMVIGRAVDQTLLYIDARPRYLPLLGSRLARHATSVSDPILPSIGGWVTGAESISVPKFDVPSDLEGSRFRLTALGSGAYQLSHPEIPDIRGQVGTALTAETPDGPLTILVSDIKAKAGAQFNVVRLSRLATIEFLQDGLKLVEKGRQSGVIDATLQDSDRTRLTRILNEIGNQYVRQNVERKAAEAEKTLAFLDVQLPQFKRALDQSEEAYNRYRNQQGTVALDEEARLILGRSVDFQSKLLEAQQRRRELISRFTAEHPTVRTLDEQIAAWNREIAALNARVKGLPTVQQDALRLERDVKVNNELYQQLRNNALQLQLIREGKVGNVRLIDAAVAPEGPIAPRRGLVMLLALAAGLAGGVALAVARAAFFRGIRNPQEIEAHIGLNVYSTIPMSEMQALMAQSLAQKRPGVHILSNTAPNDVAVESLRSLRTALQFAMLDAPNNRVVISGATPGVGKSFVSANFSAVLASGGRRVLLIDADLRKGHLNQYFGQPRRGGLSELIVGSISLESAIRKQVLDNLDLITSGIFPPNPAELVMSGAFTTLLNQLSSKYDIVVIDTAPVLAAADTLSIAGHAGTLLLVARAEQTQLGELQETARRLAHAGRQATGVIFNAVDLSRRHFGSYGYKYGAYRYRQYSYEPQGSAERTPNP
ncbi:polysaccharide biosynthesis tyrosine autokinase [Ramlibacter sp. XY19]|uniref:polysaccharide biosynthesis tyrosine autokinase n=1 Tax=Ramlibacter paludis TaxID=2908000 RepID=UPI0023DAC1FB|nr:polysaccharide biosynthesis tyrosine autokinase [Ramlibacter paludis]MCG2592028.1 polysaccharide biosynthesis tyrosine autokinase [Ramlibacter paludis]